MCVHVSATQQRSPSASPSSNGRGAFVQRAAVGPETDTATPPRAQEVAPPSSSRLVLQTLFCEVGS